MRIVVIGGGIVGASVAYHLSERGDSSVIVFDRGDLGSETTEWSVASFKMVGNAAHLAMRRDALRLYNEFMADPRVEPWYDLVGQLVVATSDERAAELRRAGAANEGTVLTDDVYLGSDDIRAELVAPDLNTDVVVGGLYRPNVGYFDPAELAAEFIARARENGVEFRANTPVCDVVLENDKVTKVKTVDGVVDADEVVCAAGPWTSLFAREIGVDLPVRHTIAYAAEVSTESRTVQVPPKINHRETGAGFRGDRGDTDIVYRTGPSGDPSDYYEMGERRDPDGLDVDVDAIRDDLLNDVVTLLPHLADATVVEENVGLLSRTPDGRPIVGRTDLEGFSVAALHAEGIQLAPAVGKVVTSELLGGNRPSYAPDLLPDRFANGADVEPGHGGWG